MYVANCLVIGTIILVVAVLKIIPIKTWQAFCSQLLAWIGMLWVDINSFNIWLTRKIAWDIRGSKV